MRINAIIIIPSIIAANDIMFKFKYCTNLVRDWNYTAEYLSISYSFYRKTHFILYTSYIGTLYVCCSILVYYKQTHTHTVYNFIHNTYPERALNSNISLHVDLIETISRHFYQFKKSCNNWILSNLIFFSLFCVILECISLVYVVCCIQ